MSSHAKPSNIQSASKNALFYDSFWKQRGRNMHYTELMRAKIISDSMRNYLDSGEHEILDFGCGRGWMSEYLSIFGKVTGVDFSPLGIQFAKDNYSSFGEFFLANNESPAMGLPPGKSFDAIVSTEVIEHTEDPLAYIRQIKSLLKPKGWLFLTTPNGNIWPEFERNRHFVNVLQPVENWLKPSRLSQILRAEGFEVLLHEGRPMYEFRAGRTRWLQCRWMYRLMCALGMEHKYGRFILMDALYQLLVAKLN